MAAPIVSISKQQNTLKRLVKKEKSGKVVRKNVLCSEIEEWPRPSDQVQDEILTKITEKLTSLPNIFKKTVKETKDVEIKSKVRSQLAIGVSQVFRDLEKDRLDCVLVSGQATPAIAVNHVISLCQERGCPILCLDQLSVSLAKSTDSKCFPLAIGFKKMSESDFTEVVSLVKAHAPVHVITLETISNNTVVMSKNQPIHGNLIKLSRPEEEVILAELKRVFTPILVQSAVKREGKTQGNKKHKKKINLKTGFEKNYHSLFDFGKRTVCNMVEHDKVQLVLVSEEITPVLLGEPQSSSLLYSASEKRCPVVMVTGLTSTLRPLCQGCVSVVGIKKCVSSSSDEKHFKSLVDVCLDAVSRISPGTQPGAVPAALDWSTVAQTKGGDNETTSFDEVEDYSDLYILKKDSKEYSEAMTKLKEEMEKTQQDQKFSSDFISLSGQRSAADKNGKSEVATSVKVGSKPVKIQTPSAVSRALEPSTDVKPRGIFDKIMVQDTGSVVPTDVGPKKVANLKNPAVHDIPITSVTTQSFTLSRSGDSNLLPKHKLTQEAISPSVLTQTPVKHSEEVLGFKQLAVNTKVTAGIDYLALSESGAKKSKKKHLKRKLETDGFLSFAYKGANIKTMTSNPNKKKKK